MTTIMFLSNELIDVILQCKSVSIKDVVNFSLTCTRFLAVVDNNNLLWQKKLYQRWPYLKRIYDKRIQNKENINFKEDVKASITCRNELRCYLTLMSDMFFHKKELADVDLVQSDVLFCQSMGAHSMNYYFLMDELLYRIATFSLLPNCNLTHKYYSKKLFPYIHQRHLKDEWQTFLNYPKRQQLLEWAAIIVAQWYQPQKCIIFLDVEASLDNIAQQVLEGLKRAHCDHPIFSTSAKQFSFWKYNNNNDNPWSRKDDRQIIDVLRTVLFEELGFSGPPVLEGSNVLYYTTEHILIDCVLETRIGDVTSLAIIFQSVARRLGVRCNLVCFPTHFFLCWKPKCESEKDEEYFYIDVLHGGLIRSKNDCPRTRGRKCPIESFNEHSEISPTEMVIRMINSLQTVNLDPNQNPQERAMQTRSLLEFRYMIDPHNIDVIENLGRYYSLYQINLSGLVNKLQRLLNSYNNKLCVEASRARIVLKSFESRILDEAIRTSKEHVMKDHIRERTEKIKYAVGMVVNCHSRQTANYTGVIIWWDKEYNSEVKIAHENIAFNSETQTHPSSVTQPFYTILSENGNTYYAAQDVLEEATPPKWIEHNEIGRYFCRFAWSHYVPNTILTTYFPYDITILNTLRHTKPFPFSNS